MYIWTLTPVLSSSEFLPAFGGLTGLFQCHCHVQGSGSCFGLNLSQILSHIFLHGRIKRACGHTCHRCTRFDLTSSPNSAVKLLRKHFTGTAANVIETETVSSSRFQLWWINSERVSGLEQASSDVKYSPVEPCAWLSPSWYLNTSHKILATCDLFQPSPVWSWTKRSCWSPLIVFLHFEGHFDCMC